MSYNVNTMKIIEGELSIKSSDVLELLDKHRDDLPESNFLEKLNPTSELLRITNLWWQGEGSGYSYHIFKGDVIPVLKGSARVMEVWEGGDTVEFYWIRDGEIEDVISY